jgi:predicted ribosome quality control (RQC) complex YloA/Tae2 family protein
MILINFAVIGNLVFCKGVSQNPSKPSKPSKLSRNNRAIKRLRDPNGAITKMSIKSKVAENLDVLSELTLRLREQRSVLDDSISNEDDSEEYYTNLQKEVHDLQVSAEAVNKTLREIKQKIDNKVKFSDYKYRENKKKLMVLQLEEAERRLRNGKD